MTTSEAPVSPLVVASGIDFRPLTWTIDEMPLELSDQAAQNLGKGNPARLTGFARWLNRPAVEQGAMFVGVGTLIVGILVAGMGGAALSEGERSAGRALLVVGVVLLLVSIVLMVLAARHGKRVRELGLADPAELRLEALRISNPDVPITHYLNRADARHLRGGEYRLDEGDRDVWIGHQYVVGEGEGSFEFGVYCYEEKDRDKDGNVTWHTFTVPYLYVPLTTALRAQGVHHFEVSRKDLLSGGDVSLASSFDLANAVKLRGQKSEEARLFVARALAPDVQELMRTYVWSLDLDLRFSPRGVFFRAPAAWKALGDGFRHRRSAEGFVTALMRSLHLVHEIFEQIDPAYKLDRATQTEVHRRAGLDQDVARTGALARFFWGPKGTAVALLGAALYVGGFIGDALIEQEIGGGWGRVFLLGLVPGVAWAFFRVRMRRPAAA